MYLQIIPVVTIGRHYLKKRGRLAGTMCPELVHRIWVTFYSKAVNFRHELVRNTSN